MTFEERVYERALGPDTAQINAAHKDLRSLLIDSILTGRHDDLMPTPGIAGHNKPTSAAQMFDSLRGEAEDREILSILSELSNGPTSVALQLRASAIIAKVAAEYADLYAADYAEEQL